MICNIAPISIYVEHCTVWMVDGTYIKASLALCLAYELKTYVMFFEP